jgi:hypothetical protein
MREVQDPEKLVALIDDLIVEHGDAEIELSTQNNKIIFMAQLTRGAGSPNKKTQKSRVLIVL